MLLLNAAYFTACRPIPEKEFVEAYVKAYYLTEPDMERWIREHKVSFNTLCGSVVIYNVFYL